MKGAAFLVGAMALLPGLALAGGEAHASGIFNVVYAKPINSNGWKAVAPERVGMDLFSGEMSGQETIRTPMFGIGPCGIQGREFGPLGPEGGQGSVEGASTIVHGSSMDYDKAGFGASMTYDTYGYLHSSVGSSMEITNGDLRALGLHAGDRTDLYYQFDFQKGAGFGANTDGRGVYEMNIAVANLKHNTLGNVADVSGSISLQVRSGFGDDFQPSVGDYFFLGNFSPSPGEGVEFYLLGANAGDDVVPETRWSAADAVRLDTMGRSAVQSLLASFIGADGTSLRDISIGIRYRNLAMTDGLDTDEVVGFSAAMGAGKAVPEPVPCLALGLGALVLLRRKARPSKR